MGLDMYLHAKKYFDLDGPETVEITTAIDRTISELEVMASLDPYEFETSVYVSGWDHAPDKEFKPILITSGMSGLVHPNSPSLTVGYADGQIFVQTTAIYWRKANAIHAWFVDNVQNGVDECQESEPINFEMLALLKSQCERALAAYNAGNLTEVREILEPKAGFFFGSMEIDEWWAEDINQTLKEIETAVRTAIEVGEVTFTYHSSW